MRQRRQARARAVAHRVPRQPEQGGDLVIGASLLEHQCDDCALVGSECVECAHRHPLKCARVNAMPSLPWRELPGFDRLYGLELLTVSDTEVTARVAVRDELKQPGGLVHGGVFASIAESIASIATWVAVHDEGRSAQGLSNQTSFLRPILDGTIHAVGRRRHRGRTTWVWEVEISDDQERLCALVRMTIAVRDA